jgi:hypothetical protein
MYIYRTLKYNSTSEIKIPENELNNIIKCEVGEKELRKMKDYNIKKKYITGQIKKKSEIYDNGTNCSGFSLFKNNMKNLLKDYDKYVQYHVYLKLKNFNLSQKINFNINTLKSHIYMIDKKFANEKILIPLLNDIFLDFVNSRYVWNLKLLDNYIIIMNSIKDKLIDYNLENIDKAQKHLEDIRKKLLLDTFCEKYDEDIFKRIYNTSLEIQIFKKCIDNTIANMKSFDDYISVLVSISSVTNKNIVFVIEIFKKFHKFLKIPKHCMLLYVNKFFGISKNKNVKYLWYLYYNELIFNTGDSNDILDNPTFLNIDFMIEEINNVINIIYEDEIINKSPIKQTKTQIKKQESEISNESDIDASSSYKSDESDVAIYEKAIANVNKKTKKALEEAKYE